MAGATQAHVHRYAACAVAEMARGSAHHKPPPMKTIDDYKGACPRCGSTRWVSVSLNGGWTRVPQCVPCGAIHPATLGPGNAANPAAPEHWL